MERVLQHQQHFCRLTVSWFMGPHHSSTELALFIPIIDLAWEEKLILWLFPITHISLTWLQLAVVPFLWVQRPVILFGSGWQSLRRNRDPLFQRTSEMGLSSCHPGKWGWILSPQVSDAEQLELTNPDLGWCENPECLFFPFVVWAHERFESSHILQRKKISH